MILTELGRRAVAEFNAVWASGKCDICWERAAWEKEIVPMCNGPRDAKHPAVKFSAPSRV